MVERRRGKVKVLTPAGIREIEPTVENIKALARECGIKKFYLVNPRTGEVITPQNINNASELEIVPYQEAGCLNFNKTAVLKCTRCGNIFPPFYHPPEKWVSTPNGVIGYIKCKCGWVPVNQIVLDFI